MIAVFAKIAKTVQADSRETRMSHYPTYYAPNEDGALWKAAEDLGREPRSLRYRLERLDDGQVKLEILDEPEREGDPPRPEKIERPAAHGPAPKPESKKAGDVPPVPTDGTPGETARAVLAEILGRLGQKADLVFEERVDAIRIEIEGADGADKDALLSGGGRLLDSLQFLLNRIVSQHRTDAPPIILDVEKHVRSREERISEMARRVADKVVELKVPIFIETVRSPERRIIHQTLADRADVTTESDGAGGFRRLAVLPRAR